MSGGSGDGAGDAVGVDLSVAMGDAVDVATSVAMGDAVDVATSVVMGDAVDVATSVAGQTGMNGIIVEIWPVERTV